MLCALDGRLSPARSHFRSAWPIVVIAQPIVDPAGSGDGLELLVSNSPSRTPVRNASHSACENANTGPCGLREWRMSTDSPAKDTSTQLPVPEAVLFRHVSGENSRSVMCSSDEGRRTPLTGESLAVVWSTAYVSAVLAGEHDRWCDPSSKGEHGQGHEDIRLVIPGHPQAGSMGEPS